MQQLLAIVILINYLAVLMPVNFTIPSSDKVAAKPYVHAKNCQQNNYLQVDCWDKCNADASWNNPEKKAPSEQINLKVASLDIHFLSDAFTFQKSILFSLFFTFSPIANAIGSDGFLSQVFPPPKLN